jgi:hypothetical protein
MPDEPRLVQPIEISTQKQFRLHGQPTFCYLCGHKLADAGVDRDHCPPKGFFSAADRINFPIILPTHRVCNNGWKEADEIVGIIADALHDRQKSFNLDFTRKLEAYSIPFNNKEAAAVTNLPLIAMTKRIYRGMHALLYSQYLPQKILEATHVPLPEADWETGCPIQPLDQAFVFGAAVRRALLTRSADTITAYNGKFRYACVWSHLSNGEPCCIFAFDIYAFHCLAPKADNFPRVFVGLYKPQVVPSTGAWESAIKFDITRAEMLDPWHRS